MNDLVQANANTIGQFLEDHKCKDVNILDVTQECSWADCFIIATVSSVGHLRGNTHELWGALNDLGLEVTNRHKKPAGDGWELIDCGDIVIHLMSSELRDFYSLERLWQKREKEEEQEE